MTNRKKSKLMHLDKGQQACCRISALSRLLMSCDGDMLPTNDLRELADLIHTEAETMRACIDYLTNVSRSH